MTSNIVTSEWFATPPKTVDAWVQQIGSAQVEVNETQNYSVAVAGTATGNTTYQWQAVAGQTGGTFVDISGETSRVYDRSESSAGFVRIRCVVTRGGVEATSNFVTTEWRATPAATLTVMAHVDNTAAALATTSDDARGTRNFTIELGGTATGQVQYQWEIAGIGQSTYTRVGSRQTAAIPDAIAAFPYNHGTVSTLRIRCRVTRGGITVTSNDIVMTWRQQTLFATINSLPDRFVNDAGSTATRVYRVAISGEVATNRIREYQWQVSDDGVGWNDIAGANEVTYSVPIAGAPTEVFYRIRLTSEPTTFGEVIAHSNVDSFEWQMRPPPRVRTPRRGQPGYKDPLAQSFIINEQGGVFLTSIDLFFHTKDNSAPVTVQIREMSNGAPTPKIIPFGEATVRSSAVNVYNPGTELPTPNRATKFTFPSPVYLQENQEYCFVVIANSNKYNLWFAQIGQEHYGTDQIISKQPYAGVMFLSQNNKTWSADQNRDIKFVMRRARFDTDAAGEILLENAATQSVQLGEDPFLTTIGSNTVRVFQKNHGFYNNDNNVASQVTISGVTGNVNGITASELNATHEVSGVMQDSYTIEVSNEALETGPAGGLSVSASQNQQFTTLHPIIQELRLPETSSSWEAKTSTGVSLGQTSPTPYVLDRDWNPININENTDFSSARVIASPDNSNDKTLQLRGRLSSDSDNISPVIDLERASVITVQNRINNPADITDSIAETDPTSGSALAKYITKTVVLNTTADGLRVWVDVNRPSATAFDLYYKVGYNEALADNADWIMANPLSPIPFTDNAESYNEIEYVVDPEGTFNSFAVKLVMTSTNQAFVPSGRDLRIISLLP